MKRNVKGYIFLCLCLIGVPRVSQQWVGVFLTSDQQTVVLPNRRIPAARALLLEWTCCVFSFVCIITGENTVISQNIIIWNIVAKIMLEYSIRLERMLLEDNGIVLEHMALPWSLGR